MNVSVFAPVLNDAGTAWVPTPEPWRRLASCRSLPGAIFFSEARLEQRLAVAVCASCPVRRQCLDAAMAEEFGSAMRFGVRGGLSAGQRRTLARRPRRRRLSA